MSSVKSLTMTYEALNELGTFSEGDPVTGTVTLTLEKDITAKTLFVKVKADANVHWTTRTGDHTHTHAAYKRYFKLKQVLIPENNNITVPKGINVYKFRIDLPLGALPSSFKGCHGRIAYKLEAVLSRSWRMNSTVEKEIRFVSKCYSNLSSLMLHQVGSTNKEMGLFSKGHANMDVTVDRGAYAPGETMVIFAKIINSSSKDMTPKFSLIQNVVYHANGSTKRDESVIHKVVDDCIKPQTQKEIKCEIKIPPNQMQSVQNCDILCVQYHVKVYLDISFAFDPEVIIPVIILHPDLAPGRQPGVPAGPYPAGGYGGPSNSDFPPPAMSMGPYPAGGFGGPSNSSFPPPGAPMGPYPAGGFGGPSNSSFPPPGAPMGPYPAGGFGGPNNSSFPPPGAPMGPYPAGGFGGPNNSSFPPPGAPMAPYPAGGFGGPNNSSFPPPGAPMGPYPAGGFGGPVNTDFPAPAPVPAGGPHPASPYTFNYGSSGGQNYSAPPPVHPDLPPPYAGPSGVYPALPAHMTGGYNNPAPQLASPYGSSSSSSSVLQPPSTAPAFHLASEVLPSPSPPSNVPPTAATHRLQPSAPMMNTDFLSISDDAPPAYSLSFLTSDTKNTDTKE